MDTAVGGNRRKTLSGIENMHALPAQPSTATKKQPYVNYQVSNPQSAKRRQSMGTAVAERQLVTNGRGQFQATPGRRQSGYRPRPSMAFGVPQVKDPRPIKDPQFKNRCYGLLVDYLNTHDLGDNFDPKSLAPNQVSKKTFENLFAALYLQLDPQYVFTKVEDEIKPLIKGLGYPGADALVRSHLQSPGSANSWPHCLALLAWMVELIQCVETLSAAPDDKMAVDGEPQDIFGQDPHPDKVFFEYLCAAYDLWFQGHDQYEHLDRQLSETFTKRNERFIAEIQRRKDEIAELRKELDDLSNYVSPLIGSENLYKNLVVDIRKFENLNQSLTQRVARAEDFVRDLALEFQNLDAELKTLRADKEDLVDRISKQDVSAADVDRMTSERDQLLINLEDIRKRVADFNRQSWEREIEAQRKHDSIEYAIRDFNSKAYQFVYSAGLDVTDMKTSGFEIELHINAFRADQMISPDVRTVVKPALQSSRDTFDKKIATAKEEGITFTEELDKLNEEISGMMEDLHSTEERMKRLTEQFNAEKEINGKENTKYKNEIEHTEEEMKQKKYDMQERLLQSHQRVQSATLEYEDLLRNSNELKKRSGSEIISLLTALAEIKTHIGRSLGELYAMADEDLADTKAKIANRLDHI